MDGRKLRLSRYSVAYRNRLLEGAAHVQKYLRQFSLNIDACLKLKPDQIDSTLDGFVSQMHASERASGKKCLGLAKHGILFFQVMRPNLRHQLKESWSTLKAWEQSPGKLRNPVPLPVLMALLCCVRVKAETSDNASSKEKWFRFSVLIGLGYFGLFRPGSHKERHLFAK